MKCSQILNRPMNTDKDPEIRQLTQDSRQVRPGSLFFCHGVGEQANAYIEEAKAKGAVAVVSREPVEGTIFSDEPRRDYALACQRFWGHPQKGLILIAVTGTNGKSSVAWQLRHVLQHCGKACGLIGTICSQFGEQKIPALYTTPDAGQLYPLLAQMKAAGCTHVVLEASSQAIAQQRLAGLDFELGIFTNLSRDHLDQHGTMEEYFDVKQSIFTQCKRGLCNYDDKYGLILRDKLGLTSYSLYSDRADYTAYQRLSSKNGCRFCLVGQQDIARVRLDLPGDFPASNAAAVLAAAHMLGIPLQKAADALNDCPTVPGRAERLRCGEIDVLIDYAHTSDGLENIFRLAQQLEPKRIYAVFGCAGERDRGDRKAMADVVLRYADRAVFTADNPRDEDWKQICSDVGRHEKFVYEWDRSFAIRQALSWCQPGDLLLLLSKGHEDYQALAGRTIYFSEKEVLADLQKTH